MTGFPWAEIATALAVFAANVLSPGPNVFNTIAIALGSGRRAALMAVPAVALGARLRGGYMGRVRRLRCPGHGSNRWRRWRRSWVSGFM